MRVYLVGRGDILHPRDEAGRADIAKSLDTHSLWYKPRGHRLCIAGKMIAAMIAVTSAITFITLAFISAGVAQLVMGLLTGACLVTLIVMSRRVVSAQKEFEGGKDLRKDPSNFTPVESRVLIDLVDRITTHPHVASRYAANKMLVDFIHAHHHDPALNPYLREAKGIPQPSMADVVAEHIVRRSMIW